MSWENETEDANWVWCCWPLSYYINTLIILSFRGEVSTLETKNGARLPFKYEVGELLESESGILAYSSGMHYFISIFVYMWTHNFWSSTVYLLSWVKGLVYKETGAALVGVQSGAQKLGFINWVDWVDNVRLL